MRVFVKKFSVMEGIQDSMEVMVASRPHYMCNLNAQSDWRRRRGKVGSWLPWGRVQVVRVVVVRASSSLIKKKNKKKIIKGR